MGQGLKEDMRGIPLNVDVRYPILIIRPRINIQV